MSKRWAIDQAVDEFVMAGEAAPVVPDKWTALEAMTAANVVAWDVEGVDGLILTMAEHGNDRVVSAADWIESNADEVFGLVADQPDVRRRFVFSDRYADFSRAMGLLSRITQLTGTSPRSVENAIMGYSWWHHLVGAENKYLPAHYITMMSRVLTPSEMPVPWDRARLVHRNRVAASKICEVSEMTPSLTMWGQDWLESGFCSVDVGAKTAAALVFSDSDEGTPSPWSAFSIVVPPGIMPPVRRIWVSSSLGSGDRVFPLAVVDESGSIWPANKDHGVVPEWFDPNRRPMLDNLVRGVCIAVDNGSAQRKVTNHSANERAKGRAASPRMDRWSVTAPVKIDLRDLVREQWETGPTKKWRAKAQWTVRGHHRNQACGKGQSDRRKTWIRPYRKGDPAAISLTRRVEILDHDPEAET